MSEVTVKDLRDKLEWFIDDERFADEPKLTAEHLAAFDAIAEKAENYDKLMALLTQNLKH